VSSSVSSVLVSLPLDHRQRSLWLTQFPFVRAIEPSYAPVPFCTSTRTCIRRSPGQPVRSVQTLGIAVMYEDKYGIPRELPLEWARYNAGLKSTHG
jgi:hypothetical protein